MQKTKKETVKGKRAGTPAAGAQASLQVRLWAGEGGPDADVPAGALAMVEDFLGVSSAEPVEIGHAAARGVFSDVVQAVNAGRRLQRLVRGYGKAVPGGLGAGLLLTGGDDDVSDEEMVELRRKQALSRAQPGQMFVIGALCDKVRSIPGLQFSEVDALANGPGGKSRRVLLVLPAALEGRSPAEDEMKTRLVESFVAPSQQDAPQAASLVIKPISGPKGNASAAAKIPVVEEIGSAETPRNLWTKPQVRWAAGAGAVLAVSAAIAMGVHGRGSAGTEVPAAANAAGVPAVSAAPGPAAIATGAPAGPSDSGNARTKANAAVSPKPSAPSVAPVPVAALAATPPETQKKVDPEPKPEVAKREPEKTPAPSPPEPKPARSSAGGASVTYSAEEIGILLSRADKDSGDGNYDRAIVEYRSILSHDPGNQRAKQGMERAIRNKNGG